MKKYAKIINEQTKEVAVGLADRPDEETQNLWSNFGMSPQTVEQSYDGRWFLAGFVPAEPQRSDEEIRQQRAEAYLQQTDVLTAEYTRKSVLGLLTEERKREIERELQTITQQIKVLYPYQIEEGRI